MTDGKQRIALLIDAENVRASNIDRILTEVARHGFANLRRAYGNWKSGSISDWEPMLKAHAIRPMQQFSYRPGKNASDMALIVDAMDLLHGGSVDAFALVSSDSDFTPLAMRLVSGGMQVYGFGRHDTPDAFVKACTDFIPLGKPAKSAVKPGGLMQLRAEKVRGDAELHELLRNAVTAATGPDGWADLARVGSQMKDESFSQRKYGYAKLSALIAATEIFEIRQENGCQVRHLLARAA